MPRPFRAFANAVTIASLALWVAAAVESVRGFRRMDQVIWSDSTGGLTLELDSNRGGLSLVRIRNAYPVEADGAAHLNVRATPTVPYYVDWGRPSTPSHGGLRWGGFGYRRFDEAPFLDVRVWTVPLGFLAGVFAVVPLVRLRWAVRRWRRVRAGACVACGYDLRATPGRCPECGTGDEGVQR